MFSSLVPTAPPAEKMCTHQQYEATECLNRLTDGYRYRGKINTQSPRTPAQMSSHIQNKPLAQ